MNYICELRASYRRCRALGDQILAFSRVLARAAGAAGYARSMDLSRRRFLVLAGHSLAVGGSGLLVACQSGPQGQQTIVVSGGTSTPAAT